MNESHPNENLPVVCDRRYESRARVFFVERHDAVMARYSLIPVDGPARSCWWYVLAAAQNLPATGMPLAVLLSAESRW